MCRCSEIHETLDECYDEENVLCQIQSAVTAIDDLCVESMEKEAAACGSPSDFVLVDAPNGESSHRCSTCNPRNIIRSGYFTSINLRHI